MHEMGIANSILEAVTTELRRYPGSCARKIGVRIGELSAVDPESLQFSFQALTRDTKFESLALEVEFVPRCQSCRACGLEFQVRDYKFDCPRCGSLDSKCIAGEELDLAYIEVEGHAEPSVETKDSE